MSKTKTSISRLGILIWIIRLTLLVFFVFFSWIPIITVVNFVLPQFFPNNLIFFIIMTMFTLGLSMITFIGILSLRMGFRDFSTIIYASGVLFSFYDPYFLAFGVVSSWLFYEIWHVANQFNILDDEYSTYPKSSTERHLLSLNFRNQMVSFILQAWITLSFSWIILFVISNLYFELGEEFGTLGIATSITMLTIVYLTQRMVFPRKNNNKTAS